MKRTLPQLLILASLLCLLPTYAAQAQTTAKPKPKKKVVVLTEDQRKTEFRDRLCKEKDLNCDDIKFYFGDPRLVIHEPPPPAPPENPTKPPKGNPYFSDKYGLATREALDRCLAFYNAHKETFDAEKRVPKEIILGHLRLETRCGVQTWSKNPLGVRPALSNLVSFYARKSTLKRRDFAFRETVALMRIANDLIRSEQARGQNVHDLLDIPGSSTGAIGLLQCEPTTCLLISENLGYVIDPFDPDDAIRGNAEYLVMLGFDENPKHQDRAIELYYGIPKRPSKGHIYYRQAVRSYAEIMKIHEVVLKYLETVKKFLADHPSEE